jgi:hypothetical protein
MTIDKCVRGGRLALLGATIAATAALALWALTGAASAHEPHPGLDFSAAATGAGISDCDTTGGDTECILEPGQTFTIEVSLDEIPADEPEYGGFDIIINYTGVTSMDNASTDSWPDCEFAATHYEPGVVAMACAIGVPPAEPSTYTGVIGTNDFECTDHGSVALVAGTGNTDYVSPDLAIHAEGAGTAETLTIFCGEPPTPTPGAPGATNTPAGPAATPTAGARPTALPGTGGGTSTGGSDATLWMVFGAVLAAGAAGCTGLAWKFARR